MVSGKKQQTTLRIVFGKGYANVQKKKWFTPDELSPSENKYVFVLSKVDYENTQETKKILFTVATTDNNIENINEENLVLVVNMDTIFQETEYDFTIDKDNGPELCGICTHDTSFNRICLTEEHRR